MPLCSNTSSCVASGSNTTLKVKGFKAPLASSTWAEGCSIKCIGESNPVLPRSAPRPGTGWCPRPCSAAPCGWWGGPWAQYCYETRDTWHVWHVTWWPRWCCPRPCRSCPPSPRTSPTRWRTWRGTPRCRGCKSKSALKWEYTENLFFDISKMQFGCEWSKWRCWNDLRQIMTKGLQTVTSICQDTTEVQYTRPRILMFAER